MASIIPRKLWEHADPKSTNMWKFMQKVNGKHGLNLNTFWDLYQWSITNRSTFWSDEFEYANLIHSGSVKRVVDESKCIDEVPRWFEGIQINFAENILWTRQPGDASDQHGTVGKEDDKIALTEVREGVSEIRELTWGSLRKLVGDYASAMQTNGVQQGDRIVAVAANSIETLAILLATTWLGAVFSSSSTDMGVSGILQRTVQINPKYIFMDDAALYNGKRVDLRQKITDIEAGWIMYLASVGSLLSGARTVLYDGSPFQPDLKTFVKLIGDQKVTKLGISPRWMHEISKAGISPRELTDLSNLQVVTSTANERKAGCFGQGNQLTPVYVGGTQGPSLGTPIAVYDSLLPNGPGKEVSDGTPGELVATAAFPNVPVYLWNDKTPVGVKGSKFHSAYFARFDQVWAHGDFVVIHPVTKNVTFLGRADGVLNPSGVRFGSAEVYGVLERHFSDRIVDSICVGQRRPQDNDESVMLFLLMRPGQPFDKKLVLEIKDAIKRDLSKRHVPKYVFETPEIPTTINLKKVELPVKQIVSGYTIKPSGTLLNPKSLEYYYQFATDEVLKAGQEKL
ncbi:hypothetical protein TruAng_000600 [Truncatella angustata]|nr:hypothetical protein TruAng_000600 [Truncatella angustata]